MANACSQVGELAREGDEQLAASQKYGVVPQSLMMEMNDAKVMLALKGTSSFRHVGKNDFVISLRSFEGGIEHSSYVGCVSPAYTVLQAEKAVVPAYFKYLLKSGPYIAALQASTDSLRDGKSISYEQFGAIALPCPVVDEQAKIVEFLDHETAKIDVLIEKQQRLIELLKEKRQAVISHAVTKGLDPNAPMKDSGVEWLGEVPAHWKVKKLKYLVDEPLMYGANEAAIDNNPNNPRFIRITDVNDDGSLRADTFCSLSEGVAAPFLLKEGDVLLARTGGTVGKSFLYANTWGKCCFAGYLIKASLNQQIVLAEWFYQYAQTRYYWDWIDSVQIQATLPNVSAEKYNGFFVPTPPINEQINIVAEIRRRTDKFDVLIAAAEQAVAYMQERRTALISAAVTGKIDVRDWQAA